MPQFALQSPLDNRVYTSSDQGEANRLVNMGYTQATPEQIKHEDLVKSFEGWKGGVTAAAKSFIDAVPGLGALTTTMQGPEQARQWQEEGTAAQQAHPYVAAGGTLAGIGGSFVAAAPVGAALAAGAAAGSAALGLGAAGTYAAAATAVGLENVGIGSLARLDNKALAHALDPDGREKLAAEGGSGWRDFAIGVATHGAIGVLGKAFKAVAKRSGTFAEGQFRQQLADNKVLQQTMDAAQQDEMWRTADAVGVTGKPAAVAKPIIARRLDQVTAEMNEVKSATSMYKFDGPARRQAAGAMESALENTPLKSRVKDWYASDLSLQELQNVRRDIYAHVDWKDPTAGHGPAYKDAGLYVGQQIKALLGKADIVPGSTRAQQWASLDKEYSQLSLLSNALRKVPEKTDAAASWMSGMVGWGAVGTVAKVAAGAAGLKVVGSVAAAKKLVQLYNEGGYAIAAKHLTSVFDSSANKLATVAGAGLYGIPAAVSGAIDHDNDYQKAAAQVAAIRADPNKAYQQMQTAATAAGLPEEVASAVVERKHAMLQYLGSQLPGRVGASDLPTRAMPDPAAQRKWLGKLRTTEDPSYGFANPTTANMAVLKQFYPGMVTSMQQTVLTHLQRNPDAPAEARVWASRVLGRPVTALTSPAYMSLMAKLREQEQQASQAGSAPKGGGGGATASSVQSSAAPTRLEQLSGG